MTARELFNSLTEEEKDLDIVVWDSYNERMMGVECPEIGYCGAWGTKLNSDDKNAEKCLVIAEV